jgi:3,4-dihydroxy-2-butanone 4-phosphate synthase
VSNDRRDGSVGQFATIEEAIEEIRAGRMLVVVDDEDRENEGDLVMAADRITPEAINFMARYGRGLICVPMLGERLDELEIGLMVRDNTEPHGTAFTTTVDARRGVTTGISAYDRAVTIRALVDPASRPEDLNRPGHIFPLRALPGGVLRRAGHTEAAVDLARMAGSARRAAWRGCPSCSRPRAPTASRSSPSRTSSSTGCRRRSSSGARPRRGCPPSSVSSCASPTTPPWTTGCRWPS